MAPELVILIISAASIAFVHTLLGPDHYVPFIAMAKARGWSLPKTLRVVLLCGSGHLVGSVALGILGIVAGIELTRLEWVESQRGELAAWALCIVGALYCVWGLRHAYRQRPQTAVKKSLTSLMLPAFGSAQDLPAGQRFAGPSFLRPWGSNLGAVTPRFA